MHRRTWISALLGLVFIGLNGLPVTQAQAATASGGMTASTTSASRVTLTTAEFETRLLALVNARRKKIGCVALRANTALITAARRHTSRMAAAGKLSHQLPGEPGLARRIELAGYRNWSTAAENIAWGGSTPMSVYNMWMNSSGHRANIQRCALRDAGIGVVFKSRIWVTMDLGRHR